MREQCHVHFLRWGECAKDCRGHQPQRESWWLIRLCCVRHHDWSAPFCAGTVLVQLNKGGSIIIASGSALMDNIRRMSIPYLKPGPFEKAFMHCFPRPEFWMQVSPRRSCFHDPQDGVKHQAVVLTLPASGFHTELCQHRSDYGPIFIWNVVPAHANS